MPLLALKFPQHAQHGLVARGGLAGCLFSQYISRFLKD
jgi:hypothetical protein